MKHTIYSRLLILISIELMLIGSFSQFNVEANEYFFVEDNDSYDDYEDFWPESSDYELASLTGYDKYPGPPPFSPDLNRPGCLSCIIMKGLDRSAKRHGPLHLPSRWPWWRIPRPATCACCRKNKHDNPDRRPTKHPRKERKSTKKPVGDEDESTKKPEVKNRRKSTKKPEVKNRRKSTDKPEVKHGDKSTKSTEKPNKKENRPPKSTEKPSKDDEKSLKKTKKPIKARSTKKPKKVPDEPGTKTPPGEVKNSDFKKNTKPPKPKGPSKKDKLATPGPVDFDMVSTAKPKSMIGKLPM